MPGMYCHFPVQALSTGTKHKTRRFIQLSKVISLKEAVDKIPDGATIMYGGFLGCGSAHNIIRALAESGKKNFTIIGNDCGMAAGPNGEAYYGVSILVHNYQVKEVIATHVGMTPDVATQSMVEKTLEVNLIPQGTLAEMIRAGGAGLGGVLTPTGVGTIVEDSPYCLGKQTIDGKDYLLMKALKADVAIVNAHTVDTFGNMWYKGTTRNFNPLAASAAEMVICEADNLVEVGTIQPENVHTTGAFVDYIVDGGKL